MPRPSIRYKDTRDIDPGIVLELFKDAGILRPLWTVGRMKKALDSGGVVLTAWDGARLVGFTRAITDACWSAWLSQLAVAAEYQRIGIGTELVRRLRIALGDEVSLLVHSADGATGFYRKAGFEEYSNVYRIERKR